MKVDMVMPQMGESIAEGTIVRWTKKVGDMVAKDENILEISTDKVDSEIPAPAAGRIVELKAKEGETVPVGQVIAVLETDVAAAGPQPPPAPGAGAASDRTPAPAAARPQAASRQVQPEPVASSAASTPQARPTAPSPPQPLPPPPRSPLPSQAPTPRRAPEPAHTATTGSGPEIPREADGRFYSPLVRAMAREEGLGLDELSRIPGSGRGGRLTRDDLQEYLKHRAAPSPAPRPAPLAGAPAAEPSMLSGGAFELVPAVPPAPRAPREAEPYPRYVVSETRATPEGPVEVVQMDTMRQRIAEHMVRSKATSPHVASVTEVDMSGVVRFRESRKAEFEARYGFRLTYTPFLATAAARALLDYPMVNSSVDRTQILIKRYVNLGIAVALDNGLIVPVVRHAEEKNFLGIARAIQDLASRARSRKLDPEDVQGGTFALTNMGGFGNLFGIPIINQPNVGILGAGAIVKRPVVVGDAIAIRDVMYLSLSYDHRVVDGALGGRFLQRVRYYLEEADLVGAI